MSGTEDYLDGLLESLEGRNRSETAEVQQTSESEIQSEPDTKGETMRSEDEYLDSFEKEFLSGDNTDDFIRQFEKELDGGVPEAADKGMEDDLLFENLDGILSSAKAQGEADEPFADMDDMMVDTLGDLPGENDAFMKDAVEEPPADTGYEKEDTVEEPLFDDGFEPDSEALGSEEEPSLNADFGMEDAGSKDDGFVEDDSDLMDLLQSEGDFSDIGDMLKADEQNQMLADGDSDELSDTLGFEDLGMQEEAEEAEQTGEQEESSKKSRKKKKKEKAQKMEKEESTGFIQKISHLLFGDDEESEETGQEPVKVTPAAPPSIEELSDENLQILQDLEGAPEAPEAVSEEPVEDEKEKKKREKQEAKEKAKQEKAEKKAQAKKERAEKKAQKVKKEKPPKEPDNSPPLPKKPVVLTFIMVASFMALVLIGTNLVGYSNSIENAAYEYGLGNYEAALAEVSGMELKEQDSDTYQKYWIMANASGEYRAYQTFLASGIYDMALDSLIRTIGRCEKYQEDAEEYGCAAELSNLRSQAAGALASFGLTEEQTLALYVTEERDDYSKEIYALLAAAGFAVDAE